MTTVQKRKKVCLFGLSGDPPTGKGGHVGIVSALSNMSVFDEIRVLPVYQHNFSEKRNRLMPFHHRVNMCRLAFVSIPKAKVSELERVCFERNAVGLTDEEIKALRVGTADLLDMLQDMEPNSDFYFALGADTFMDLTSWKWRRSKDVLSLLQGRFVVFRRAHDNEETNEKDVEKDKLLDKRIELINLEHSGNVRLLQIPTLTDVSSTRIRSCVDEGMLKEMLVAQVLDYMKEHKLYSFSSTP